MRFPSDIVESLPDIVYLVDTGGYLVNWNGVLERVTGYDASEIQGMHALEFFPPEEHATAQKAIREAFTFGYKREQLTLICKDGSRVPYEYDGVPLKSENGKVVGLTGVGRDISRLKEAWETIDRLASFPRENPNPVLELARNGEITYQNESADRLLEELQKETFHDLLPDRFEEIIRTCLTSGKSRTDLEAQVDLRLLSASFFPIPAKSVVHCYVTDITEKKARRVALEAAQMGTWAYDAATDVTYLDRWAGELLGLADKLQVTQQEILNRIHENDRAQVERKITAALSSGSDTRFDCEYRVRLETGTYRWVRSVGRAQYRGDTDRTPRRFLGVLFDTTDAHSAWEAMEKANQRAEHHLAELQTIVGQMTEGLLILDADGNVVSMNQAAQEAHDFARADEAKQHLHQIMHLFEVLDPESGRTLSLEEWPSARVLRGETFTDLEVSVRNQRTDRTWIASCGGTPIRDASGRVQLAIITMHDVTERKCAEQRLQQLNETLEQRVAERTAEARQRADQLQRLAGELTEAEQRERRRLAQLLHDDLQQILVAAKMRLTALTGADAEETAEIRQLLGKAIQTSRSLSTELAPPALYDLGLNAAVEWFARWVDDNYGLKLEVETDDSAPAESEPLRALVFEAIRELSLNVIKHANVNEARVALQRDQGQLHVAVEDFGKGFEPGEHDAKFTPSSYGLFSVKERLELSGGSVQISSSPGEGTRVEISVPLSASPQPVAPSSDPPEASASDDPAPTMPKITPRAGVLLVDDHDLVLRGLADLINEELDMEVVAEAASGEEAIELARQHRPDVIVIDISLPDISGIEATRRILEDCTDTQVIGLSVHRSEAIADELRSAGAVEFFNKGEDSEHVIQAIRRLAPV